MDDNELLHVLAKACGWKNFKEGHIFVVHDERGVAASAGDTCNDAWNNAVCTFPDWLHSVDAALALPWPEGRDIEIESAGSTNTVWWTNPPDVEYPIRNEDLSDTLARALCEVFAQWAVAQEAKEGER